ncbi:MAG TPA: energy transducer TonB [Pyrinomonadaceae bacterium]|nr:energy transducer TonB [Pyrinomonadaceae bacterium]
MTIKFGRILFLTFLLTTHALVVAAQSPMTAKGSGYQPQPTSAANENDRTRDGLLGPVRRIRTEVTKVSTTEGKLIENGKRVLLEAAEYDLKGVKTVNQYFPVAGAAPTGREVYKYDDKGNISEMTLMASDGSMVSKETYKYDYDSLGNWTKMTTSVAVVENGTVAFEPVEVTYRTISYYLDARMTNLLQPANTSASVKTPVTGATNGANTNPKPSPQQTLAPLQFSRRSPVTLTGQYGSPMFADVRTLSFTTNQKVPVDSAPPPPSPAPRTTVSRGVLNGAALSLPPPVYPDNARRARVEGTVDVEVVIDENGKVLSAKVISGPAALRDSAVQAAQRARFTPTKLSGQPVKVTGKIVYNFKLAN